MKQVKNKENKKLNIKKIAVGSAIVTGAVATGVIVSQVQHRNTQGNKTGVNTSGLYAVTNSTVTPIHSNLTTQPTHLADVEAAIADAFKNINSTTSSSTTQNYFTSYSDITPDNVVSNLNNTNLQIHNGGNQDISLDSIVLTDKDKTPNTPADKDSTNVHVKLTFTDHTATTPITWDEDFDLSYAKSANQRALDLNLVTATPNTTITNNPYNKTTLLDKNNWTFSAAGIIGLVFDDVTFDSANTEAQINMNAAGDIAHDVKVSVNVHLGVATASKQVTVNFTKLDKQSYATAAESAASTFTITGDKQNAKLNAPANLVGNNYVGFEYSINGSTWTTFPQSAYTTGINLPAGHFQNVANTVQVRAHRTTTNANFIFQFANNDITNSAPKSISSTALKNAYDAKDLIAALTANTLITLNGRSDNPSIAFGTLPSGIKLEFQSPKDSNWYDATTAVGKQIYQSDLWDNTNGTLGSFRDTTLSYRISPATTGDFVFDSSATDKTSKSTITGTTTPATTTLKKLITTTAFAGTPKVSGTSKTIVLPTITNNTNNTDIEFSVLDNSGQPITAATGDAAKVKLWLDANNFWNATTKAWVYKSIVMRFVSKDTSFELSSDQQVTIWSSTDTTQALTKVVAVTDADLTGKFTFAANSKPFSVAFSGPTDKGYQVQYRVKLQNNTEATYTQATLDTYLATKNLYDTTNNRWDIISIKAQLIKADNTFEITGNNELEIWNASTSGTKAFVETTALPSTPASGNSNAIALPSFSVPTGVKVQYQVFDKAGAVVADANATGDETTVENWLKTHNFWDATTKSWSYSKIEVTLLSNDTNKYVLSSNQKISVWTNADTPQTPNAIKKYVDISGINLTAGITFAGKSNNLQATSTLATDKGYKIVFKIGSNTYDGISALNTYLTTTNLYNTTSGNWDVTSIKAQLLATDSNYVLSTSTETDVWKSVPTSGTPTSAVIESSTNAWVNLKVSGKSDGIVLPTLSAPAHTEVKFTVYDKTNSAISGATNISLPDLQTYLTTNGNLWVNNAWKIGKITAVLVASSSDYEIKDAATATIFDAATPPTGFIKSVDTSSLDLANLATFAGDSDTLTLTEGAIGTNGLQIQYSTDNGTTWISAAQLTTFLTGKNLWDTTGSAWSPANIKARFVTADSTQFEVMDAKVTTVWSGANTAKVVTTTAFASASLVVTGNTKNVVLPTLSPINGASVEFEVYNGSTLAEHGDATAVQNWIKTHNLWNASTQTWSYTNIKVKYIAQTGFKVRASQEVDLWTSTSEATTHKLDKFVETTPSLTTGVSQSGDSKHMTFTEPNNPSNSGYTYEYVVYAADGITALNTGDKTNTEAYIVAHNLWDINRGTSGAWGAKFIKVHLKLATGFVLEDSRESTLWDATSTTTVKFVEIDDFINNILKQKITVDLTQSHDDQHLTWTYSDVDAALAKYNLKLEYSFDKNGGTPITVPSTNASAFEDIASLATKGIAWPSEGVPKDQKVLWMKISPISTSFAIDTSGSIVNIAHEAKLDQIARHYTVTDANRDGVVLQGIAQSSKNLVIAEPSHPEFTYKYSIDGKPETDTTKTWLDQNALNTALLALDTNEGMWDSTTQTWRIQKIELRMKATSEYVLGNNAAVTLWDSATPGKFNKQDVVIKKYINTATTLNDIKTAVVTESSSLDNAVSWTTTITNLATIKRKGIKIEFLLSEKALPNNGQQISAGWTTDISTINRLNEDKTKRFLYAKISAANTNDSITTSGSSTYVDLTTTSGITAVKTSIDTSTFVIDQGVLQGDSHHLTGKTVFTIANSGLTTHQQTGIEIVYSLSDFATPIGNLATTFPGIKAQMSEAELKNLFTGSADNSANLWDLSGSWKWTITAKFIEKGTDFKLTSDQKVSFDFSTAVTAGFKKFIDTTALISALKNTATTAIPNTTSTNDAVTWSTTPTLSSYVDPITSLEFLYGNYADATAANAASGWSTSLPTSVSYVFNDRHLWVRFTAKSGYVLSNSDLIDLTTTSGIQNIKSKVDNLSDYTAWTASAVTFVGTNKNVVIDPKTIPQGAKVTYQVKYSADQGTTWNTSTWLEETGFKTLLSSNLVQIRTIRARLETSDANKYVVVTSKDGVVNVSHMYSQVDTTNELDSTKDWNATNIQVLGVLGSQDGIQVILPDSLLATKLVKKGLVLQISVNGNDFTNFIAETQNQAADPGKGFLAANAGKYVILTAQDFGKNNPKSVIKFRIIANKQDNLTTATTVTDQNNWLAIQDDVKVKTSDVVDHSTPSELVWNLSTLPKLVQTDDNWLSTLTLSGTSRNITIGGFTEAEATAKVIQGNSQGAQTDTIKIGFRASDGALPSNLYFLRDDFVKWLAGTLPANTMVYNATTNSMEALPTGNQTPNWNTLDMSSFKVRWISTDSSFKVSNSSEITLTTHDKVAKWTDLTTFLNSLKTISITGDTNHLSAATLAAIRTSLTNAFGADAFDVESTAKFSGATGSRAPDWLIKSTNALPAEINFDYELGFRIVPKDDKNFVASTEAHHTETNIAVTWDKNSASSILKYLHVASADLAYLLMTGDTRTWTYTFADQYLKTDKDGVLNATGAYEGVEVYAYIDSSTNLAASFSTPQPINDLKAALAAANINIFDGTWGRDKIKVQYHAKTGFEIPTAQKIAQAPDVTAMNRYIDISAVIADATTHIVVEPKDITKGWWNDAATDYSDKKTWGGYVDNKDFKLHAITVNTTKLKIKIQYSLDNLTWTDAMPTELGDISSTRKLWIKYVVEGAYTTGTSPEIAVLSDATVHDITTASKVLDVPTRIDITGVDLSKVKLSGTTRVFTQDDTTAHVPAHTHLEYSITKFTNPSTTNTTGTLKTDAIAALAAIGVDATKQPAILAAYKASMTFTELQSFVRLLTAQQIEILRNSLTVRLVPEVGYSLTQTDEATVRKSVDVSNLYTFKDITTLAGFLKLASSTTTDGISLYGQKGVDDGIYVSLPDALVNELKTRHLSIQYTTDGIANATNDGTTIASGAKWTTANPGALASNSAIGNPSITNGFKVRLDSIKTSASTKNFSFIAFRIVPDQNDEGQAFTTGQPTDSLSIYYDGTKSKMFIVNGTTYTPQNDFYSVDTTKIPTVIKVDGLDLRTILAKGNTKDLTISKDDVLHAQIDALNGGATSALDDNLEFLYAIDKKDGTFINGNKADANALWLTKEDMIAYLHGDLIVNGTQVVYASDHTKIVEAFTAAEITARNLKNGAKVLPNYLAINTVDASNANSFFVKWASMDSDYRPNADYIPSNIAPEALGYTPADFKKWFDGTKFNAGIQTLVIRGTTESSTSWTVDYSTATYLQDIELKQYKLKMQYSFDNTTWQDDKLDFSIATWAQQVAHKVYMRVVPQTYTSTVATGVKAEVDGIFIDYSTDTNGGKEAKDSEIDANGVSLFKTYLNIADTLVQGVVIKGNSFALDATDPIVESTIDTDIDKFNQVEIQYLFNGVWYNKTALLAKMSDIRTNIKNADDAAAYVAPADFNNTHLRARWHVLDSKNFVIKDEVSSSHTTVAKEVTDKSHLKTFVNIWKIQEWTKTNFNGALDSTITNNLDLQKRILTIASSSTKDATGKVSYTFDLNLLDDLLKSQFLIDNDLKIQWSVDENATDALNSVSWKDWDQHGDIKNVVYEGPLANDPSKNPTILIRIVPKNSNTTVVSTTSTDGNGTDVAKIVLDTSAITYKIFTDSAVLANLAVTGDTQDDFVANEDPYLKAHSENGGYGVTGIDEYITDDKSQQILAPTEAQVDAWLKSLGAQLNYQVVATRTKGAYTAGHTYTFNTKALFYAALKTHDLNFDASTLRVRWNFTNPKYVPSDVAWVAPNVSNLVNVVYTEDIYNLTTNSLLVTGNDLKLQAPIPSTTEIDALTNNHANTTLLNAFLNTKGLKIQYNWKVGTTSGGIATPDASAWSDDAPDGSAGKQIDADKHYWIRFVEKDATKYKIDSDKYTNNKNQVTLINVAKVKLAIAFNKDSIQDVTDMLAALKIEGKTYDFNYVSGHGQPSLNQSYVAHSHIQYSHDGSKWSDTIKDMLSDTDYYNNGILQLDKDRGDKLFIRYVYDQTGNIANPVDSPDYVYTDKNGNEIALSSLKSTISIDDLVQPIFTSATLGQLTGQTSITANGLHNPTNGTDFAGVTWNDFANYGLFKPNFVAGNTDTTADFKYMWYDGVLGTNGNYVFNLAQNPFNSSDKENKVDTTALLLRHTHLQYRWSGGPTDTSSTHATTWVDLPETGVQGIQKNSNYDGLELRLVADAGYTLTGTGANGEISLPTNYLDNSSPQAQSISAQSWTKRYKVVVELRTKDVKLPTTGADQATFIGWNDSKNASGTFATNDASGDHTPSNDVNKLKDIIFKLLKQNGTGADIPLDFAGDDRGYVLEWNVTNNGQNITWTDSRKDTFAGWHSAVQSSTNPNDSKIAPGSSIPWYGAYPTSLKNGDVVQVRLRARDGFTISNDDGVGSNYDPSTKTSDWSHVMSLLPITSLTTRIDMDPNFAFYDPNNLKDFQNRPITQNPNFPIMHFNGNEGQGTMAITGGPNGVHYKYEVAILRPVNYSSSTSGKMDDIQRPTIGYCLENDADQATGLKTMIYTTGAGWVANYKHILNTTPNVWKDPKDVKDLSVGDVVIVRLVAETGYGFEWEDKSTSFADALFPKQRTYDFYGTSLLPVSVTADYFDTNADQISPNGYLMPVPVRGLKVKPRYVLNDLALVYNTDPAKNLDNGNSEISLNKFPGMPDTTPGASGPIGKDDKYHWVYTITTSNGVVSNKTDYVNNGVIKGMRNGDILSVWAEPINASYELDASYVNTPVTFKVSGLALPLEASGISKPIILFGGYDENGTISSIKTAGGGAAQQWEVYSSTDAEYATYPLGRPVGKNETKAGDLIWQYQVVHYNPSNASDTQLSREPWSNDIPKDLKYGDYVRMRVGTIDPTKVALANGTTWVYSENPNPITDGSTGAGGTSSQRASWFAVQNLDINTSKIDYEMDVTGFIKKTNVSLNETNNTDEIGFVTRQIKVIYADGRPDSPWIEIGKGKDAKKILGELQNGDKLVWRAVANDFYKFKDGDQEVTKQDVTPWVKNQAGDDYVQDTANTKHNVNVLQKASWTYTVTGLKIYVDTNNVLFIPNPDATGGIDFNTIIVDSNGTTLADLLKLSPPGGIIDGSARLKPITIDPSSTKSIVDVDGKPITDTSIVGVQYIVKTVDPFTGEQQPEFIIDGSTGEVPKNLSNGDEVTVQLFSTNDDYQLSSLKSWKIKIAGLTVAVDTPITDPFLTFSGDSGKGSISINPQAPKKTKWIYAVVHELQPGQKAPVIDELANPNDHTKHPVDPDDKWLADSNNFGTYYWTSNPPTNLVNGDMAIAMLVPAIAGSSNDLKVTNLTRPGERPMSTDWVIVTGLAQKIDLSRYSFKLVDESNMWTPQLDNGFNPDGTSTYRIPNYAFKFVGHQEGQTGLAINAQLSGDDKSQFFKLLVDQNLKPLPKSIADTVQWAFAVNNNPNADGDYAWSTTAPQALSNGEYVHIKLVGKSGLKNVEVYGYQPQVFQVKGLDAKASIANKVVTLVAALIGGTAALGTAVGVLLFIRRRKKKMHFSE